MVLKEEEKRERKMDYRELFRVAKTALEIKISLKVKAELFRSGATLLITLSVSKLVSKPLCFSVNL